MSEATSDNIDTTARAFTSAADEPKLCFESLLGTRMLLIAMDHGLNGCNDVAGVGDDSHPVGEGIVSLNRPVNSNLYAAARRQ
ncbi:MAG: hypothetical protein Q9173_002544 [Seirophora scorigena]